MWRKVPRHRGTRSLWDTSTAGGRGRRAVTTLGLTTALPSTPSPHPFRYHGLMGGQEGGFAGEHYNQNAQPRSFPCGRWQPGPEGTAGQETWLTVITHISTTTGLKNHLRAHRNPLKGSLQPEEDLQGGFGLLLVMISTQLSSLLTKNPWLVPAKHG